VDGAVLGTQATRLATLAAQSLYPLSRLRYPSTLTAIAADTNAQGALTVLRNATWDTSVKTLADEEVIFATSLASAYQTAVNAMQQAPSRTQWAAISIPNPNLSGQLSGLAQLDAARARAIWSALGTSNTVTISLNADDLYNIHGATSLLTCTEGVPVITAMGLYWGMPDPSYSSLQIPVGPQVIVSDSAQFPTVSGLQSFRVLNTALTNAPVKTYFGLPLNAMSTVQGDFANAQMQAGISPFTQFSIDVTGLKAIQGNPISQALELDLVFQFDVEVGPTLSYLPACK
jgi:hypothetical protein